VSNPPETPAPKMRLHSFFLSKEERDALEEAVAKEGFSSKSEALREMIRYYKLLKL
jgi:Arc/MetJ-type ribon-helix-helix transcriptional regulator